MKFGKILTLNNGVEIPQIQLETGLINNDDVRKTVRQAIDVGYRAFDTTKDYGMKGESVKVFGTPILNVVIYF